MPYADHLFNVKKRWLSWPPSPPIVFTATLFFPHKHARPNMQAVVSFLCTRVKCPDVEEYKKLSCAMQYLQESIHVLQILEAIVANVVEWCVDVPYAMHGDVKIHKSARKSVSNDTWPTVNASPPGARPADCRSVLEKRANDGTLAEGSNMSHIDLNTSSGVSMNSFIFCRIMSL